MKTVLFNRHSANVFLAFLLCRTSYIELALWIELHYNFFPLIKESPYPSCIDDSLHYIMMHPTFFRETDDVGLICSFL